MWQKELTLNSSRGTSEEQMSVDMKTFLALACFQNGIHVPLSFPSGQAECNADIPAKVQYEGWGTPQCFMVSSEQKVGVKLKWLND